MKNMAKKFLEDCGNIKTSEPVENSRQKKIVNHSKELEIFQKPKEAALNQPSVSKVEKCDLSLTKYELIENSIEEEKGIEQLRKKMKSVGSRNRIKYYIQEDPSKEELHFKDMYYGMDYSMNQFQNRPPSRVRASLSYEKLPFCHPSMNQSKLLCEGKYDSFYNEGESILKESQRRGRKFKYL